MAMKQSKMRKSVFSQLIVSTLIVLFGNCGDDPAPSLFDPDEPLKPQPVIQSVEPPDSALAGVGEVAINGQNFSSVPGENLVFFNEAKALVLQSSPTRLIVRPPNLLGDSIAVKIAVHGADKFSDPQYYKLIAAVSIFGRILEGDVANAIALDLVGNVYVAVKPRTGTTTIIKKITPDGTTTDFAATTFLIGFGMKMGPANTLYVAPAGRIRRIATFGTDGVEQTFVNLTVNPQDIDFDQDGSLWVVGASSLVRVKPDKTVEQMATYPVRLLTVRIFNGFVYVAGENANTGGEITEAKIWRSEILGDQLGTADVVLDIAAAGWLNDATVNAITFAADGDMILATNHANAMFWYYSDGSNEVLYPGLFSPAVYSLSYGEGLLLYAVRQFVNSETGQDNSQLYRITMTKTGAPYYGRR